MSARRKSAAGGIRSAIFRDAPIRQATKTLQSPACARTQPGVASRLYARPPALCRHFRRLASHRVTDSVSCADRLPWGCGGARPYYDQGDRRPRRQVFRPGARPGEDRHYYIAAEPEVWNFAPEGAGPGLRPGLSHRGAAQPRLVENPLRAVCRREFFRARAADRTPRHPRPGAARHDGAISRSNLSQPRVASAFDAPARGPLRQGQRGLLLQTGRGRGAAVAPGAQFTYVWHLDEASGPRPDEPSSKAWLYHSHTTGDEEINLGLVGFLVVTDPARARADGTPRDVDREMAALFTIYNEASADAVEDADDRPPRRTAAARRRSQPRRPGPRRSRPTRKASATPSTGASSATSTGWT